jgi:hypothetical protein
MIVTFDEPGPLGFNMNEGGIVGSVKEDGHAFRKGVLAGDVLTAVMGISTEGREFDSILEFIRLIRASGDPLRIQFYRKPTSADKHHAGASKVVHTNTHKGTTPPPIHHPLRDNGEHSHATKLGEPVMAISPEINRAVTPVTTTTTSSPEQIAAGTGFLREIINAKPPVSSAAPPPPPPPPPPSSSLPLFTHETLVPILDIHASGKFDAALKPSPFASATFLPPPPPLPPSSLSSAVILVDTSQVITPPCTGPCCVEVIRPLVSKQPVSPPLPQPPALAPPRYPPTYTASPSNSTLIPTATPSKLRLFGGKSLPKLSALEEMQKKKKEENDALAAAEAALEAMAAANVAALVAEQVRKATEARREALIALSARLRGLEIEVSVRLADVRASALQDFERDFESDKREESKPLIWKHALRAAK